MSDDSTTLGELRQRVREFVEQRDWQQFHAPKNLAMSIALEAAELMELFQWVDVSQSIDRCREAAVRERLCDEIADVCCYVFSLANAVGIDLSTAILAKLEKNAQKYPVERYRGRFELPDDPAENGSP